VSQAEIPMAQPGRGAEIPKAACWDRLFPEGFFIPVSS